MGYQVLCPVTSSRAKDLCPRGWVNRSPNSRVPRAASHKTLSDNLIPDSRELQNAARREQ